MGRKSKGKNRKGRAASTSSATGDARAGGADESEQAFAAGDAAEQVIEAATVQEAAVAVVDSADRAEAEPSAPVSDAAEAEVEQADAIDSKVEIGFEMEEKTASALASDATETAVESAAGVDAIEEIPAANVVAETPKFVAPVPEESLDLEIAADEQTNQTATVAETAAVEEHQTEAATAPETVAVEERKSETTTIVETVDVEKHATETAAVAETVAIEKHATEMSTVTEAVDVEGQAMVRETTTVVETVAIEKYATETATVAMAEVVTVEEHTSETATVAETVDVEEREDTVAVAFSNTREPIQSTFEKTVDAEAAVDQSEAETANESEMVAVEEHEETAAVFSETREPIQAASKKTVDVEAAVDHPSTETTTVSAVVAVQGRDEIAAASSEIPEPIKSATYEGDIAESEIIATQHASEVLDASISGVVEGEKVSECQKKAIDAAAVATDDLSGSSMGAEEAHLPDAVADAATEEMHAKTAVAESEEQTHAEVSMMSEEKTSSEENHSEVVATSHFTKQQMQSHTEVATEMDMKTVDVDETVTSRSNATDAVSVDNGNANTPPATSALDTNSSTEMTARSRPMLTTERSFVMEDDHTIKADDTVVVSERMSTDGEDDFEDSTHGPTEGLQAAVIANSMSMMRPALEKRHSATSAQNGKSHQSSSVAVNATESSSVRRSSEDSTPNATPTRARSRSNSRPSTPDTGFVKPPPAAPTVPVPPKRASIMAPTASSSAKHQIDDAPKKTPTRSRSRSSEVKPEISETGFIKPPPAPPTKPITPKRASIMAPTASYAAKHHTEDAPKKTPTRTRSHSSEVKPEISETGFIKPPPAPPTVPIAPKRASIMAPTASYAAKHQTEDAPKKTLTRTRSQGSEAKPEVSDTGFIKPPPAPPTVPIPPKRASIMAPTASYAAKHQTDDAPKKTPPRMRSDKTAKPEISDTGFVKPPPAPPTVPVPPKRASIMAPTASSAAKWGHAETADASQEAKTPPRARKTPPVKPEVSDTGFIKPPPPPPTVPVPPKRASIMAPTASSAAKRGGPDVTSDVWSRDAPPKPATRSKSTEFVPTVPVAPKRASIMAPTASFRAKSGPEVVVEELPPPPVETKPLYRNKRYANVQSKVLGIINAPAKKTEPTPSPPIEEPKQPAPVQKPTMFKSKRYANVQSKIKDIIHSGPSQPNASAVERRRSLGSAKRDATADAAVRRRSSLIGTSALRASGSGSGSGSDSSDPFAQALAARAHKKKLNNATPRYLSYEKSGVYAQRAQTQHERRRRLEEQNKDKSQVRQHQLRVLFAEKLHVNYNAQEAEHSQAALGNVGSRAPRRANGNGATSPDEFPEAKSPPKVMAGGVYVLPSAPAAKAAVEVVEAVEASPSTSADDGVTKKINFDDTSDDEEEEEAAAFAAVPVADVA